MRIVATIPPTVNQGFTLTEMVVTMVIIGVLAVFLVPNLAGISVVQQRADYDKLTFALQYARKSAIARRRYACVALSANAATLTIDPNPPESTATPFGGTCPFGTALSLPSQDSSCSGTNQTCFKTISIAPSAGSFQFDPLGRASASVTIAVSGFPTVKVESDTGLVH
jgi:prepilin-type N-terminal cleavage/methylation domain-containing protein